MHLARLIAHYKSLCLHEIVDHDRFLQYAIVHHSSAIEGSTLTENETRLLLEENVTPKGKPLDHSLMVKDHYAALLLTLQAATQKKPVTAELLQSINAAVMRSTGGEVNGPLGTVNVARGEFRKSNVSAGGNYFMNYDKVIPATAALADNIQQALQSNPGVPQQLELSFTAHFDFVTIHPFYDGSGRTSRLLMNFIQQYFHLPLAIVFKEDKAEYLDALQQSRKQEDTAPFLEFMSAQYTKHLQYEISQYNENETRQAVEKRKKEPAWIFYFLLSLLVSFR